MSLTTSEVDQYIRMTLKQYKFSHLSIEWVPASTKSFLGRAYVQKQKIQLNKIILGSFRLFEEVLKHEIAHFIQYRDNGNKFLLKNNRWQYHGEDFKRACEKIGVRARTKIPVYC